MRCKLAAASYPDEVKFVAGRDGLLCIDAKQRMTLEELLAREPFKSIAPVPV